MVLCSLLTSAVGFRTWTAGFHSCYASRAGILILLSSTLIDAYVLLEVYYRMWMRYPLTDPPLISLIVHIRNVVALLGSIDGSSQTQIRAKGPATTSFMAQLLFLLLPAEHLYISPLYL